MSLSDIWRKWSLARSLWRASKAKYGDAKAPRDADGIVGFVLAKIPEAASEAYIDDAVKLVFCPTSEVLNASYVAQRLEGRSRLLAWWDSTSSVGTYRPGMQLIQVSYRAAKKDPLGYPYDWKDHVDTAGHEIGHYIDHACGFPHRRHSFVHAWASERRKFDSYTASCPSEFFADTFWMCCMYPEITSREIPITHAWFREFFRD